MQNKIIPDKLNNQTINLVLKFVGIILPIVAMVYVFERIWSNKLWAQENISTPTTLITIMGGSLAYSAINIFLVGGWRQLITWFGEDRPFNLCYLIYGRTQIAKYIPGNVFHLPSRHFLGRDKGISDLALLGAAFYEIFGLLFASGIVSIIGIYTKAGLFNLSIKQLAPYLFIIFLIILIIKKYQSKLELFKNRPSLNKPFREIIRNVLLVTSIYLGFFIFSGVILWVLVQVLSDSLVQLPIIPVISIFSIAWIGGFITPGAPAGVGVREMIMILALSPYIGEALGTTVSLMLRVVTVSGDLVFYLLSIILSNQLNKS